MKFEEIFIVFNVQAGAFSFYKICLSVNAFKVVFQITGYKFFIDIKIIFHGGSPYLKNQYINVMQTTQNGYFRCTSYIELAEKP